MPTKIAIIGAGLSGLTLARHLKDHADVMVFEKSHSVGGRMSTRETGESSFDHGAQYFSVKSEAFISFLKPYLAQGAVSEWKPNLVELSPDNVVKSVPWTKPRYVASPGMRSLCEVIAEGLNIRIKRQISGISKRDGLYWLQSANVTDEGPFDWVISAIPSAQAESLLPRDISYQDAFFNVEMKGCYALMLGFSETIETPWDAAVRSVLGEGQAVSWVAVNSHKPDRPVGFSILAQSSNDWANERLDANQEEITDILFKDLEKLLGQTLPKPSYQELHKWRYANVAQPAGQDFLIDIDSKIASIGDWCLYGKVEAAFLSGHALAQKLLSDMI